MTPKKEQEIIDYWKTNMDNTTKDLIKKFGITSVEAHRVVDDHIKLMKKKMKLFNS